MSWTLPCWLVLSRRDFAGTASIEVCPAPTTDLHKTLGCNKYASRFSPSQKNSKQASCKAPVQGSTSLRPCFPSCLKTRNPTAKLDLEQLQRVEPMQRRSEVNLRNSGVVRLKKIGLGWCKIFGLPRLGFRPSGQRLDVDGWT